MAGPTDGALERLFDEARSVFTEQGRILDSLDTKAAQLVRMDLVVIGILFTALTIVGPPRSPDPADASMSVLVTIGMVLLTGSMLLAMLAYTVAKRVVGLEAESLVLALDIDLDERTVMLEAVEAYADAIARNSASIHRTSKWLQAAFLVGASGILVLVLLAISIFSAGVH